MTMANKRITFRSTNVIGGIMLTITMMASLAAAATSKECVVDKCFTVYKPELMSTYDEAKTACDDIPNFQLAVISNAEENAALTNAVESLSCTSTWIGLKRQSATTWWNPYNNIDATYFNWESGEPNNANGVEDCVQFRNDGKNWNDLICSQELVCYACMEEISASPSLLPTPSPSTSPSDKPSLTPSASPSLLPTPSPSTSPSVTPSLSNAPSTSVMPSSLPSCSPSDEPSESPTLSSLPSSVPSLSNAPTKVGKKNKTSKVEKKTKSPKGKKAKKCSN